MSAGPPPVLAEGDDDIFWVNQLHVRTTDPLPRLDLPDAQPIRG